MFCTAEEYLRRHHLYLYPVYHIALLTNTSSPLSLHWEGLRWGLGKAREERFRLSFAINHNECLHYHDSKCLVTKHIMAIIISQHPNFDLESLVHWYNLTQAGTGSFRLSFLGKNGSMRNCHCRGSPGFLWPTWGIANIMLQVLCSKFVV